MAEIWFTSDFHFGHANIIRYCNRPFEKTEEMDEVIVDRVNTCVKPNHLLYFLGDFCFGGSEKAMAYRQRLQCKTIHFIEGNHDKIPGKLRGLFASWNALAEIHVGKQKIVRAITQCVYGRIMGVDRDNFTVTRTETSPTNHFRCRWMSEWTRMTSAPGISRKYAKS